MPDPKGFLQAEEEKQVGLLRGSYNPWTKQWSGPKPSYPNDQYKSAAEEATDLMGKRVVGGQVFNQAAQGLIGGFTGRGGTPLTGFRAATEKTVGPGGLLAPRSGAPTSTAANPPTAGSGVYDPFTKQWTQPASQGAPTAPPASTAAPPPPAPPGGGHGGLGKAGLLAGTALALGEGGKILGEVSHLGGEALKYGVGAYQLSQPNEQNYHDQAKSMTDANLDAEIARLQKQMKPVPSPSSQSPGGLAPKGGTPIDESAPKNTGLAAPAQ